MLVTHKLAEIKKVADRGRLAPQSLQNHQIKPATEGAVDDEIGEPTKDWHPAQREADQHKHKACATRRPGMNPPKGSALNSMSSM